MRSSCLINNSECDGVEPCGSCKRAGAFCFCPAQDQNLRRNFSFTAEVMLIGTLESLANIHNRDRLSPQLATTADNSDDSDEDQPDVDFRRDDGRPSSLPGEAHVSLVELERVMYLSQQVEAQLSSDLESHVPSVRSIPVAKKPRSGGINGFNRARTFILNAIQRCQKLWAPVLKSFRPKCSPHLSRVEWTCSCGKTMYGDYTKPKTQVSDLARSLPDGRLVVENNAHRRDPVKSSPGRFLFRTEVWLVVLYTAVSLDAVFYIAGLRISDAALFMIPCIVLLVAIYMANPRAGWTPLQPMHGAGSENTSEINNIVDKNSDQITAPHGDSHKANNASLGQAQQSTPAARALRSMYSELCVNRGSNQVSLCEIQLTDVQGQSGIRTDLALFKEIPERYDASRRHSLRRLLYRPQDINFVQFGDLRRGVQTGIYDKPLAIPPKLEVDEKRYHYHECPLDPLPPIDRGTFFHYFWTHDKHPPPGANPIFESLFMSWLPKKLGDSIFNQREPKLQMGWEVHIIEGPNKPLLAW